jgi:hypothetical protein
MIDCPRCGRSFIPTGVSAGESIRCPNCRLELGTPSQPPPEPSDGAGQGRGEENEYAVRVEPASPAAEAAREYVPLSDYTPPRMLSKDDEELEDREPSPWETVREAPPRDLFFAGTFGFPFRRDALSQLLMLVGVAVLTILLLGLTIYCAGSGDGGFVAGFPILAAILFAGLAASLLIVWLAAAAIYGICVVRETSYGVDAIENWPHAYSLDAFGDVRYVLCALVVGALPAMVAAPFWDWIGWPKTLMMTVSAAVLFPLLLLSMLERNSPMMPFSPPVWQSVTRARQAWGLFYAITLPAAVAMCLLVQAAIVYAGVWGELLTCLFFNVAWMIYCRLLGRLAWFCSGNAKNAPR